jgi:hypothetical protein
VAHLEQQVIELRLQRAHDMFEMPQTDLFSEYRNFLTGVELCISELRSRSDRRPVRLEIELPPDQIDDDLADRVQRTLRRYCAHRTRYNAREQRATRLNGISALRIGIPIALAGLAITAAAFRIDDEQSMVRVSAEFLGWVLAWIGLWFPLDALFFYPLAYGRENRVLALLGEAEIVMRPYGVSAAGSPS